MNTKIVIALIAAVRRRAHALLIKEMENRDIKGLSTSHGSILAELFRQSPMRMSEIAEKIGRDKSTVTTLVKKLKRAGYIKLKMDPDDCRAKLVSLTEKGKDLEKGFKEISAILIQRAYSGFTEDEKLNLVALLTKMRDNL